MMGLRLSILTSIPLSDSVCVDRFRPAMTRSVGVFVVWAVRSTQDFAWWGSISWVSHLVMSVVATGVTL